MRLEVSRAGSEIWVSSSMASLVRFLPRFDFFVVVLLVVALLTVDERVDARFPLVTRLAFLGAGLVGW